MESKFTFHLQDDEAVAFVFKREDKNHCYLVVSFPGSNVVERKCAEEDKIARKGAEEDKIAGVIEGVLTAAKIARLLGVFDGATADNLDIEDNAKEAPALRKIAGVSGTVTVPVDGVTKLVLDSGSEVNAKRKAQKEKPKRKALEEKPTVAKPVARPERKAARRFVGYAKYEDEDEEVEPNVS
jgi:hypothetical protein